MLNELCVTASTPTAESILGSFNVLPTFCPVTFARWERHAVAACQFRVRPDAARGRDRAGRLCAQTDLCDKETVGRGLDFTIAVDPSAMSRVCHYLTPPPPPLLSLSLRVSLSLSVVAIAGNNRWAPAMVTTAPRAKTRACQSPAVCNCQPSLLRRSDSGVARRGPCTHTCPE